MAETNLPESVTEKAQQQPTIDYAILLDMVKKRWWWFVISFVMVFGAGILLWLRHPAEYSVQSNIMVRPERSSLGSLAAQFDLGAGQSYEVDDELAIISSYSVMNTVARELKANCSYSIKPNFITSVPDNLSSPVELFYDPALPDTLSSDILFRYKINKKGLLQVKVKLIRDKSVIFDAEDLTLPATLKTSWGTYVIGKTKFFKSGEKYNGGVYLQSFPSATESLLQRVSFSIPSRRSNMIRVAMESAEPGYSRLLINTIVETYKDAEIIRKREQQSRTLKFIDERLASLSKDLSESESSIEAFKKDHQITDLGSDVSYTMGRRSQIERQLTSAETQLELLNLAYTFLSNPENRYSLIPALGTGTDITKLPGVDSYNSLILKRMELTHNAKSDNAILKNLDQQLDAMRENILTSLERSRKSQQLVVKNLQDQENTNLSRISGAPTMERQYLGIQRQQKIRENIFVYLLQLREETELNIARAESRSEVVDSAYTLLTPLGMGLKKRLVIFFFLAVLIPLGLIFLKYRMRTRFHTRKEVEKLVTVPILGEMCEDDKEHNLVVKPGVNTSVSELFRLIRTNLAFMLRGDKERVVLVTSSTPGEGKSFISVNLAASLALQHKRVLLIGMDLRKPRLPQYLGIQPRFGLTEYVTSDKLTVDDLIFHMPDNPYLDVIVGGPIPPNPAELLLSPKVGELLKELREKYDYIIIDSAPVGMVSDTFTVASLVDATIYVCRADYTPFSDLEFAQSLYNEKRLPSMSLLVNGVHSRAGYGYGYGEHTHSHGVRR